MESISMQIYIDQHTPILFLRGGFLLSSMGDRDGSKNIAKSLEMENLSLNISTTNRFSRDLLQRFMGSASEHGGSKEGGEEIELNLGLSMGGRFGVDKSSKKLARSSSVASCLPDERDDNDAEAAAPVVHTALVRTSSLPVETEEEWRKRKELQTLRRMEAKRRRSEKQRNLRTERDGGGGGSGSGGGGSLSTEEKKEIEVNLRARLDREKSLSALKRQGSSLSSQFGFSASNQAMVGTGADMAKGKGSYVGTGFGQLASQGSVESKGGSSSTVSDLESKNLQGSSGELSPASIGNQDIGSSATKASKPDMDNLSKRAPQGKDMGTNSLEDMPCVFTKGDGPNGRRVDGILYKYGKGEDVRIMCICHGSFYSPAEFVKHAGGTDFDNPLKHIVVNPNSPSFL